MVEGDEVRNVGWTIQVRLLRRFIVACTLQKMEGEYA
jgi:hypothetical protein